MWALDLGARSMRMARRKRHPTGAAAADVVTELRGACGRETASREFVSGKSREKKELGQAHRQHNQLREGAACGHGQNSWVTPDGVLLVRVSLIPGGTLQITNKAAVPYPNVLLLAGIE